MSLDYSTFVWGMVLLEKSVPSFRPVGPTPATDDLPEMPGTYEAFWFMLQDLEPDVFRSACAKVATDCEFVSVRAIREAATQIQHAPIMPGAEAWGLVMDDVRRGVGYPYAGTPINAVRTTITDPLILKAVDAIGGWRLLQTSTTDQDVSNRSQFIRCYEQLAARRHDEQRQTPVVLGEIGKHRELAAGVIGDLTKKLSAPNGGKK